MSGKFNFCVRFGVCLELCIFAILCFFIICCLHLRFLSFYLLFSVFVICRKEIFFI